MVTRLFAFLAITAFISTVAANKACSSEGDCAKGEVCDMTMAVRPSKVLNCSFSNATLKDLGLAAAFAEFECPSQMFSQSAGVCTWKLYSSTRERVGDCLLAQCEKVLTQTGVEYECQSTTCTAEEDDSQFAAMVAGITEGAKGHFECEMDGSMCKMAQKPTLALHQTCTAGVCAPCSAAAPYTCEHGTYDCEAMACVCDEPWSGRQCDVCRGCAYSPVTPPPPEGWTFMHALGAVAMLGGIAVLVAACVILRRKKGGAQKYSQFTELDRAGDDGFEGAGDGFRLEDDDDDY